MSALVKHLLNRVPTPDPLVAFRQTVSGVVRGFLCVVRPVVGLVSKDYRHCVEFRYPPDVSLRQALLVHHGWQAFGATHSGRKLQKLCAPRWVGGSAARKDGRTAACWKKTKG